MTIIKLGSFGLKKGLKKLKRKKSTVPKVIGKMAQKHFRDSFRKGGFTDKAFEQWEPRRKRLSRTRTSDTLKERANLIKSGALRRATVLKSASFKRIKLGTAGIKYANRHNLGLKGMPQRQFVGDSFVLEKRIKRRLEKEIGKVLKK